jgi:hypothetical protein
VEGWSKARTGAGNTAGARGGPSRRRPRRGCRQIRNDQGWRKAQTDAGKTAGLEVGPEEGDEEPVGKSEAAKVGPTLGPMLGILLRLEVGP